MQAVPRAREPADLGERIRDPDLLSLYRRWTALLQGRIAPKREEIDPADLPPPLLPKIFIVQLSHRFEDFRCTLAGTALRGWTGMELTGKRFGDLPIAVWNEARAAYEHVIERALPFYAAGLPSRQDPSRTYDKLLLPLSQNGLSVTRIVGALSPRPRRAGFVAESEGPGFDSALPTARL
jgi:hypothetical protein